MGVPGELGREDEVTFPEMVERELEKARAMHGPQHSAHEAYAVILEELDEFWEEVRLKQRNRDPKRMLKELVQIAAMAQRTAEDLKLTIHPHPTLSESLMESAEVFFGQSTHVYKPAKKRAP